MSDRLLRLIGALLLALFCLGGSASSAFAITCTVGISPFIFPSLDATTGSAADTVGAATLNCNGVAANRPVRFCIGIDGGTAFDATSRFMTNGGSQLRFQLFTDSARTIPWGSWMPSLYGGGFQFDGTNVNGSGTFTIPIFGRILPNQQSISDGVYSSALTAIATYESNSFVPCPAAGDGTTATSFNALVRVTAACTISASNLNFGAINLLTSNVDATSNISAQCANGAPYNIGLSAGNGPGATVAVRQMTQGANTLNYSLYRDSSRTGVWGNTIGTDTVAATGTGVAQSFIVYGRIPPQTTPGPGAYTDTIVVTLTF